MDIKNEVLIRVYVVLFLIVLAAIVIFSKAVWIEVKEGDKWRARGDSLYVKMKPVDAERGNILTEDGDMLATSLPFFEIRMDLHPDVVNDDIFNTYVDSLAFCLATYVDNSFTVGGYREYLIQKRLENERYLLIKKDVPYNELEKIRQFPIFNRGRYRGGFIALKQSKRDMPYGMLANRTVGYVRKNSKPVGLEGYFNDELGGKPGQRLMKRVGKNTWIPVTDLTTVEPKTGDDIVSTIDINLQDITQEALLRALQHHNAKSGTAIIMEVKTGAIRAISNIGKTDNGWWETYNHAIGSAIEPGSTYKLASIMALLEDGYVNLYDTINIEFGKSQFYEEEMLDASTQSFVLDSTSVKHAFEISSNVGIAKMVHKYYGKGESSIKGADAQKFLKRLKQFNLHLPIGIEIEGEAKPYIKDPDNPEDNWSGTTLPWMSIGYEVTTTPLQLLSFYNAVANDGVMMKPYLVSEVQHFGETIKQYKPTVIKKRIASKSTIQKAQILLESVVENGTASSMKSKRYKFAGKTGTAQIDYKKFKPKANIRYRASFAGYFPTEDPIYSCIVVITDPKQHGQYGGEVALPVFREIADKCFVSKLAFHKTINQKPKRNLKTKELPTLNIGKREDFEHLLDYFQLPHKTSTTADWAVVEAKADSLNILKRSFAEDKVPNVVGMGIRDALFVLENKGLKVVVNGVGKIVRQSLLPGTRVRGQTIKLTLN